MTAVEEESKPFLADQATGYQTRYLMFLSLKAHKFLLYLQLAFLGLNIALLFYGVRITAIQVSPSSPGAISEKAFCEKHRAIKPGTS